MLVVTRRRDEGILVGGGIRIMVVEIKGDRVRLGITAPQDVPVFREEVTRRAGFDLDLGSRGSNDGSETP